MINVSLKPNIFIWLCRPFAVPKKNVRGLRRFYVVTTECALLDSPRAGPFLCGDNALDLRAGDWTARDIFAADERIIAASGSSWRIT